MYSYDIGRVLKRTFGLVVAGVPSAGVLLLVVQVASAVMQVGARMRLMADLANVDNGALAPLAIFTSVWFWALIVISTVLGGLSYAGSIHGYLRLGAGKAVTFGECLSVGLAKMLPVLGLTVLWMLAIWFGFVLIFVPGIMLVCMWSVVIPVLIAEDRGIIACFGRSRELTRGSRWPIFLTLLVVVVVLYLVVFGGIGALLGVSLMNMSGSIQASPAITLAMIPFGWIFAMVLNALLASIYEEVLAVKEGGNQGELADVFG